jgi:hypothetical protein
MLDENSNVPKSVQLDPCPAGAVFWDILIKCLKRELFGGRNTVHGCMNKKAFSIPVFFVSDMY